MRERRQPPPELDAARLRALALHYVGKYATTRGKLTDYLRRKLRERGWSGDELPNLELLVEEFAARGYVNDQSYAQGKAAALKRQGMGSYKIRIALQAAGIESDLIERTATMESEEALALALDFARRRRIGPFASTAGDQKLQARWIASFLRAGHRASDARKIVALTSPDVDIG